MMTRCFVVAFLLVSIASSLQASNIESIRILPTCTINPNDRVVVEVQLMSATYPTYLFQPTDVTYDGKHIEVDIYATSGLGMLVSYLVVPVDLGRFHLGEYEVRINLHGDYDLEARTFASKFEVSGKRCEPLTTDLLYWADGPIIRSMTTDGSKLEGLMVASSIWAFALDPSRRTMYWIDSEQGLVERARTDGSHREQIFTTSPWPEWPYALVVDETNRLLYWTLDHNIWKSDFHGRNAGRIFQNQYAFSLVVDERERKLYWASGIDIRRGNSDGSSLETIVSDTASASVVALDPRVRKLYWNTEEGLFESGIYRTNLDGSQLEPIAIGPDVIPTGILLDVLPGKIYWANSSGSICRTDQNGGEVEIIVPNLTPYPENLTFDPKLQKLFWSDDGGIYSASPDGSDFITFEDTQGLHPSNPIGLTTRLIWPQRSQRR